jgi:formylglycine-generating enzyme required for sulfatase activity
MRSSMTGSTLLLIMGVFFFQLGCSLSQQPDKQSLTNSIGIKLMLIPKGKFLMGSPETEKEDIGEIQHEVTIDEKFYMGATEVTQAQWFAVMETNPSKFKGNDLPVESISWEEAVDFCKRLSEMPEEKKAGRKYRLPNEAEWEYACRAGTTTPYHFGSQLNGIQANCNGSMPYGTETQGPYLEKTSAAGKYSANAWGLYDMHGNVSEWCSDSVGGPYSDSERVYRGGCWCFAACVCRSDSRNGPFPVENLDYAGFGFRVVMSSFGIPK